MISDRATPAQIEGVKRLLEIRRMVEYPSMSWYSPPPSIVLDNFLFLGDYDNASNIELLQNLGIKHILTIHDRELDENIRTKFNYFSIISPDSSSKDVKQYFEKTNKFLHDCYLAGEKVLVHCQMGISRSSTLVLAYLMKYHHETLEQSFRYLLEKRPMISPNIGFLLQLVQYEEELRKTQEIDTTKNDDDNNNNNKEETNPIKTVALDIS
ncbi:unnamed protein product [Didymodactylos carnosus]|uniref:protein-tyrosine-phosphatase n=1 Tax=Didymodactylos carnosus TaxID=1234261 RepID=A0A8S2DE33_9BILA|nr:unnamed protein product [Didymodactylos carnosus]CAF3664691.1 unnamed protein product [Didymodactylos carnosus]